MVRGYRLSMKRSFLDKTLENGLHEEHHYIDTEHFHAPFDVLLLVGYNIRREYLTAILLPIKRDPNVRTLK